MTAEQIALEQLAVMKWQMWVTAAAIVLAPLCGILYARWDRIKQAIRQDQLSILVTLLGERKAARSEYGARALNTIDVVYSRVPTVRAAWKDYYDLISQNPMPSEERISHSWFELLNAMATHLGYRNLGFTDLDKFYLPRGHFERQVQQKNMEEAFFSFLKKASSPSAGVESDDEAR